MYIPIPYYDKVWYDITRFCNYQRYYKNNITIATFKNIKLISYVSGVCDVIFGDEFKFTLLSVPYCLFSVIQCAI
jgi:hypothetical protein